MKILPIGLSSWLIELDSGERAMSLYTYLSSLWRTIPAISDLVPGARTILLDCERPGLARTQLTAILDGWNASDAELAGPAEAVEIPVHYDGDDLPEIAQLAGCTEAEVIAMHGAADLRVAFCGFSPGFAYLSGLPSKLHLPRLAVPRTAVPAGSVALAAGYTGVYPRQSPGGWRIIGHTTVTLWDTERTPPALLTPGTPVRFTAVTA